MMSKIRMIFDCLAMIAVIGASAVVIRQGGIPGGLVNTSSSAPADSDTSSEVLEYRMPEHMTQSEASRRAFVIEFSDFECPFCAQFDRDVFDRLKREYVDPGTVTYVTHHFPLEAIHSFAFTAAEAAECARTQGEPFKMRRVMFANQRALSRQDILKYGEAVGLDASSLQKCLEGGVMTKRVRDDIDLGMSLGVEATPTLMIGSGDSVKRTVRILRRFRGSVPYSTLENALRAVLAKTDVN